MFKRFSTAGLNGLVIVIVMMLLSGCGSAPTATSTAPSSGGTTAVTSTSPAAAASSTSAAASSTAASGTVSSTTPAAPTGSSTAPAASPETGNVTTSTPSAGPTPDVTTVVQPFFPGDVYVPEAEPYIPAAEDLALFEYALELINQDRADQGLTPVELAFNAAAQQHAVDMLENNYLAHWDTDGLKPYMRYTGAGGLNYEKENSAYVTGNKSLDPRVKIKELEYTMVYDDASSNWGHRDNIWNSLHRRVSLGIAYTEFSLALVQQFEGDYVEFYQPPVINDNTLALSGRFTLEGLTLNNVAVTWDALPQPLTGPELAQGPYRSYGLGATLGQVLPPPPAGAQYNNLPAGTIVAEQGLAQADLFWIEADISPLLTQGPGVYTICLIAVLDGRTTNFTNYSIWIE